MNIENVFIWKFLTYYAVKTVDDPEIVLFNVQRWLLTRTKKKTTKVSKLQSEQRKGNKNMYQVWVINYKTTGKWKKYKMFLWEYKLTLYLCHYYILSIGRKCINSIWHIFVIYTYASLSFHILYVHFPYLHTCIHCYWCNTVSLHFSKGF